MHFLKPLLLIACLITISKGYCQKNKLDSIKVIYVNAEIETPIAISCDKFDKAFLKIKKNCKIKNKKELMRYENIINGNLSLGKENDIDVRYKFFFYAEKSQDPIMVICMNKFFMATLNGQLITNKKMLILLKQNALMLRE
jgi:hypothetical protein